MDEMKKNNTGNVKTICRRRSTWNLGNGKIFILLRDSQTDIIDLMTCLCLHAIESRKLRNLLSKNPRNISLLVIMINKKKFYFFIFLFFLIFFNFFFF